MSDISMEAAVNRVLELGLMTAQQIHELRVMAGGRAMSGEDFLQAATRRDFLTPYQVERLSRGETSGYFYGDYKVLYFVGAGTFGRVFRAAHRISGDVVALKVLRQKYSDDPVAAAQFIREGELGKKLQHPNIVAIRDVCSTKTESYFVMEFIEGSNLREFLKIRERLEPVEALRMVLGIALGLECAAKFGITHRDMRMSNVLVSSKGEAKLLDFGLAVMDRDGNDDSTSRTVDYAALENSTGTPRDDRRSDIFFTGAILYQLLTGESAYTEAKGRNQRPDPDRFLHMVPIRERLADLPIAVETVVQRAMALDPARRYQTPGQLADDIRQVIDRLERASAVDESSPEFASIREAIDQPLQRREKEEEIRGTLLVAESDPEFQNLFREGFRRNRFQVILTSDPQRAVERVRQDPSKIACVLFSCHKLGRDAYKAFDGLKDEVGADSVPAILLLSEKQAEWKGKLILAPHRIVLMMPILFRALRGAVDYLVEKYPPVEEAVSEEATFSTRSI